MSCSSVTLSIQFNHSEYGSNNYNTGAYEEVICDVITLDIDSNLNLNTLLIQLKPEVTPNLKWKEFAIVLYIIILHDMHGHTK